MGKLIASNLSSEIKIGSLNLIVELVKINRF